MSSGPPTSAIDEAQRHALAAERPRRDATEAEAPVRVHAAGSSAESMRTPSMTAECVWGEPSTRKWPDAGTSTFVAPSRALPSGMCGSKWPNTDTMRPLTDWSLPEHDDRLVVGQERADAGHEEQAGEG